MKLMFERLVLAALTSGALALAQAADQPKSVNGEPTANANTAPADTAPNPSDKAAAQPADSAEAKRLFAANCSWCHQDYGMRQGDGPKLAGTSKSEEQVIEQIKRGKSPMPSFEGKLSEKEIKTLAHYIKALPAN